LTRDGTGAAWLASVFVLGIPLVAWQLALGDPATYARSVQEDGALEWGTFWSFLLAGGAGLVAAHRARSVSSRRAIFLACVAGFCLFVAFEEISWGQRLLGYRSPLYFLEHNAQQELNLHNIVEGDLRQALFLAIVIGFGVLLPLINAWDSLRRPLRRLGIVAPDWRLAPAFAATATLYAIYPWSHSGEWAELMLGSAMGFTALLESGGQRAPDPLSAIGRPLLRVGLYVAVVALLGFGSARGVARSGAGDGELLAAARLELEALREDVGHARTRTRCGLHKRLHSFVEAYGQEHLRSGAFARLQAAGLPFERARFFLDPWESPYWLRHSCSSDRTRRSIFVYSMGPNRKRDSTAWAIAGDDLAGWISQARPLDEPE
jgi:hypothetical protein